MSDVDAAMYRLPPTGGDAPHDRCFGQLLQRLPPTDHSVLLLEQLVQPLILVSHP